MTTADERAFLEAVRAQPDDDTPRLVFADWLDERGQGDDAARAALIRAQCRLERLPDGRERSAAGREVKALLKAHAKAWTAPLRAAGLGDDWTFRRGFIDAGALTPTHFVKHAELIFRHAPLLRAVRFPHAQSEVTQLAACPYLARLAAVDLTQMCTCGRCPIDAELRDLFRSPHAAGLERLSVARDRIDAGMVRALVASSLLIRLTALDLFGNPVGAAGLGVLAEARRLPRLEELTLGGDPFDAGGADALSRIHLPALTRLRLSSAAVRPAAVRALVAASFFPDLTELDLSDNRIGEGGAAALAKLHPSAKLTVLDVRRNGLSEKAIRALKARFENGVKVA